MPWQRDVADVSLEIDDNGQLFYRTVVLSVMRQQGKTSLTLPVWVHRAVRWPDQQISWTMQTAKDAGKKWRDEHLPAILVSPLAAQLHEQDGVRKANGSEHVRFRNGSIQTLLGSNPSAGHGQVVDLGIIDEAMAQKDDRLHQALRPAMKTRNRPGMPGAQLWIVSTVGAVGEGEWFQGWVGAGRASIEDGTGDRDRFCYIEYSAPDDADPADPETWRACMPALGITVDEATVLGDYREALLMPDGINGFRRQSLNQRTAQRSDPVIPLDLWDMCVADVERPAGVPLIWAVDVAPNQASASILVGWVRVDGVPQIQLIDRQDGVGWLPGRVAELRERWSGDWLLDPRGASASQAASWPGRFVAAKHAKAACSELEAMAREVRLGHYGQPELRAALEGAVKRPSDDGGWTWARRGSHVDISPLVAASIVVHHLLAGPEVPVPSLW